MSNVCDTVIKKTHSPEPPDSFTCSFSSNKYLTDMSNVIWAYLFTGLPYFYQKIRCIFYSVDYLTAASAKLKVDTMSEGYCVENVQNMNAFSYPAEKLDSSRGI